MAQGQIGEAVVEARLADVRRTRLGLGAPKAEVPYLGHDVAVFRQCRGSTVAPRPPAILRVEPASRVPADEGDWFLGVAQAAWPVELWFPGLLRDAAGHAWGLALPGTWSVADAEEFLRTYALSRVAPDAPVLREDVEELLRQKADSFAREQVAGHRIEALRSQKALPLSAWQQHIGTRAAGYGLRLNLAECLWRSDGAATEEERRCRQERRDAELEEIRRARAFEIGKKRIEADAQRQVEEMKARAEHAAEAERQRLRSEMARVAMEASHAIEMLKEQHDRESIEAKERTALARLHAEIARRRAEVELAELEANHQQRMAARARAQEAAERAKVEYEREIAALREARKELARLTALLKGLSPLLFIGPEQDGMAAALAGQSLSGAYGGGLASLGIDVSSRILMGHLANKGRRDGEPIRLEKVKDRFQTRSIAAAKAGTVQVEALPVDSLVHFQFTTQRAGHVTLLNIGTSGENFLHVPNAYVGPKQAWVRAGGPYDVPNTEEPNLLPERCLARQRLFYKEIGPPGVEHMAVIVSDEALVDPAWLSRPPDENPFVVLSAQQFSQLCDRLARLPANSWSAGVLSFLVG